MTVKNHTFETEVNQLLHLVTHSLYSNPDIFIRELISNASDACDKLRFLATSDDALYENDGELAIRIEIDKDAKTLTISDNGIGMNEAEVIDHLGTIAKSGTKAFLDKLSDADKKDGNLIGQLAWAFIQVLSWRKKSPLKLVKQASQAVEGCVGYQMAQAPLPPRALISLPVALVSPCT